MALESCYTGARQPSPRESNYLRKPREVLSWDSSGHIGTLLDYIQLYTISGLDLYDGYTDNLSINIVQYYLDFS